MSIKNFKDYIKEKMDTGGGHDEFQDDFRIDDGYGSEDDNNIDDEGDEFYYQDDDGHEDEGDYWWENDTEKGGLPDMVGHVNFEKLYLMGLIEYKDIVIKCIKWFEKQIASGSYGEHIIPPLDSIVDYIIGMIGNDYKDYIKENELDNISRFIYQEIDKYIYD